MPDPLRPTQTVVELIDTRVEEPTPGSRVFGLGLGGSLVPVVWGGESHKFFVAWMKYPKIPASVRQRLVEMYK